MSTVQCANQKALHVHCKLTPFIAEKHTLVALSTVAISKILVMPIIHVHVNTCEVARIIPADVTAR